MSEALIEIPLPSVSGMDELLKPSDHPVKGNQRLVPFINIKHFGTFPVIWVSPYVTLEPIEKDSPAVQVVHCIVLLAKGPPHPNTAIITIRADDLKKCPIGPVEW
jgi:hypothetical protein